MSKRAKTLVSFVIAGMLLLSVGVGFVLAQETAPVALDSTAAETRETSLSNCINKAGVSVDQPDIAIPQEWIDKLDELVAQGKITEQQKEQCLERMQNGQCQGWGSCLNSGSGNINSCGREKTAGQIEEQQVKAKLQSKSCC